MIRMADGSAKKAGEIAAGDRLEGPSGLVRVAQAIKVREIGYLITLSNGSPPFSVSGNHRIPYLKTDDHTPAIISVESLLKMHGEFVPGEVRVIRRVGSLLNYPRSLDHAFAIGRVSHLLDFAARLPATSISHAKSLVSQASEIAEKNGLKKVVPRGVFPGPNDSSMIDYSIESAPLSFRRTILEALTDGKTIWQTDSVYLMRRVMVMAAGAGLWFSSKYRPTWEEAPYSIVFKKGSLAAVPSRASQRYTFSIKKTIDRIDYHGFVLHGGKEYLGADGVMHYTSNKPTK